VFGALLVAVMTSGGTDAILDRIILKLTGDGLRKQQAPKTVAA
jgi:hypothetical protein